MGRTRRFRPVAAGEFESRFVQAAPACGGQHWPPGGLGPCRGAAGPAALPGIVLSAAAPRPEPQRHLSPQVTPATAPGTRHPAPRLSCGVPGRLPRQNREPEEERAARPPAARLLGLQPSPPAPQPQPRGRASSPSGQIERQFLTAKIKHQLSPPQEK